MKHTLVLVALLLAAMTFYIAGSIAGALALVCLGVLLELGFWFGIIRKLRGNGQLS